MKTITFECTRVRISSNTLSNPILMFEDGSQFDYSQRFERIIVGSVAQIVKSLTATLTDSRGIAVMSTVNAAKQILVQKYGADPS